MPKKIHSIFTKQKWIELKKGETDKSTITVEYLNTYLMKDLAEN